MSVHLNVMESSLFGRFDFGLAMPRFEQLDLNVATSDTAGSSDVDTLFSYCSNNNTTRDLLLTGRIHCSQPESIRSFRIYYPIGRLSALDRVFCFAQTKKAFQLGG
jgi:hypothetical protein